MSLWDKIHLQAQASYMLLCGAVLASNSKRSELIFNPRYDNVPIQPKDVDDVFNKIIDKRECELDPAVIKFCEWVWTHGEKLNTTYNSVSLGTGVSSESESASCKRTTADDFTIIHDERVELAWASKKSERLFLFHGSGIENWWSILISGLKNCSGTALQTSGAAYGNGIYMSDTLSISLSYGCSKEYGSTGKIVIGVYEVCGDLKAIKKAKHIYVIPDETTVICRRLIFLHGSPTSSNYDNISAAILDVSARDATALALKRENHATLFSRRTAGERKLLLSHGFIVVERCVAYGCSVWNIIRKDEQTIEVLITPNYPFCKLRVIGSGVLEVFDAVPARKLWEIIGEIDTWGLTAKHDFDAFFV